MHKVSCFCPTFSRKSNNSAVRYYEHFNKDASILIIVVSEDGMIDVIPNLRPQISHSEITKSIKGFKKLLNMNSLNRKIFNKSVDYFQSISFYLNSKECKTINETRIKIEDKFANESSLKIIFPNLKPNSEMNDSYYL